MTLMALQMGLSALNSVSKSQKDQYGYFQHPSGQLFEYKKEKPSIGSSLMDAGSSALGMYNLQNMMGGNKAMFGGTQPTQATSAQILPSQYNSYQPFGGGGLDYSQEYQIPDSLQYLLGGL